LLDTWLQTVIQARLWRRFPERDPDSRQGIIDVLQSLREQALDYFFMEKIRMNKLRLAFRAALFVSTTLTLASLGHAQATRTWVSGVGDDVNPCSRTAPCRTFAGAISKTAAGGEIDALDPGGFGSVVISKSITIDGTGVLASILAANVNGITINSKEDTNLISVRLRGLSINGLGSGLNGINVIAADKVVIEDSVIDGFGNGINVAAGAVFVKNTAIRNNKIGVNAADRAQVGLTDVQVVFNGKGLVGGPSIVSFNNVVLYKNP
jgi:hypothetical protein